VFSVAFWLSASALAVSALAAVLAATVGRSAHRHPGTEKRLRELEAELLDVLDTVDKLTVVAKRKYARDAARDKRKPNGADLSDDEWKKAMQAKLATGQWRPQ